MAVVRRLWRVHWVRPRQHGGGAHALSPRLEDVHPQAKALLREVRHSASELQTLTQTDAQAYASVSRAMKMAKETEEEKQARTEQLQKAMKWATEVPMQVARGAEKVAQRPWRLRIR